MNGPGTISIPPIQTASSHVDVQEQIGRILASEGAPTSSQTELEKYELKLTFLKEKYDYIEDSSNMLRNRLYHVKKEIMYLQKLKRVLCQRLTSLGDDFMKHHLEIPDDADVMPEEPPRKKKKGNILQRDPAVDSRNTEDQRMGPLIESIIRKEAASLSERDGQLQRQVPMGRTLPVQQQPLPVQQQQPLPVRLAPPGQTARYPPQMIPGSPRQVAVGPMSMPQQHGSHDQMLRQTPYSQSQEIPPGISQTSTVTQRRPSFSNMQQLLQRETHIAKPTGERTQPSLDNAEHEDPVQQVVQAYAQQRRPSLAQGLTQPQPGGAQLTQQVMQSPGIPQPRRPSLSSNRISPSHEGQQGGPLPQVRDRNVYLLQQRRPSGTASNRRNSAAVQAQSQRIAQEAAQEAQAIQQRISQIHANRMEKAFPQDRSSSVIPSVIQVVDQLHQERLQAAPGARAQRGSHATPVKRSPQKHSKIDKASLDAVKNLPVQHQPVPVASGNKLPEPAPVTKSSESNAMTQPSVVATVDAQSPSSAKPSQSAPSDAKPSKSVPSESNSSEPSPVVQPYEAVPAVSATAATAPAKSIPVSHQEPLPLKESTQGLLSVQTSHGISSIFPQRSPSLLSPNTRPRSQQKGNLDEIIKRVQSMKRKSQEMKEKQEAQEKEKQAPSTSTGQPASSTTLTGTTSSVQGDHVAVSSQNTRMDAPVDLSHAKSRNSHPSLNIPSTSIPTSIPSQVNHPPKISPKNEDK